MPYSLASPSKSIVCYETYPIVQRTYLSGGQSGTDLGGTTRQFFNFITATNQIQFLFTNYYNTSGSGEANIPGGSGPGPITLQATIEVVAGTPFYQLTFNGATSTTIAWNGHIYSDPIDYDFAAGSTVWLRTYVQVPTGFYFPCNQFSYAQYLLYPTGLNYNYSDSSKMGDNFQLDTPGTGNNDTQTSGTAWITTSSYAKGYTATAVVGQPVSASLSTSMQIPVVGLVGDSRMFGFADTFAGYLGYAARALRVAKIPFLQLSGDSEQMANVGGSSGQLQFRVRRNLLNLCTHVVVEYSTNDIYIQGASFATLKSYAQSTWQQFYNRGLKVFAETGQPQTTGTWTTAAGQTPTATGSGSTTAQAWNAYLRTWTPNTTDPALSLLSGVIDVAAMTEVNASNVFTIGGGRWYCGPGNNTAYTNDGIHLNGTGNAYVAPFYPASAFYLGINGNTGEFAAPFNPLGGA